MPTPTYTPLATVTLGTAASSVTFSSIPATYRDLIVVFAGTATATNSVALIRLNSDTGSNYSSLNARGNGSNAASASTTTTGAWFLQANSALGTTQSNAIGQIMDYSATDKHKTILSRGDTNNTEGPAVEMIAARWANTAAVTSVQVYLAANNFASGSTFSLYGVIA
jgi:hypothetical protein